MSTSMFQFCLRQLQSYINLNKLHGNKPTSHEFEEWLRDSIAMTYHTTNVSQDYINQFVLMYNEEMR